MRLTLRTLLAYLDDTLEPGQARDIGEKVAQSELAQQLMERIKVVTRRRGLTAPPAKGDAEDETTDPNTVAEYLDNVLPSEQLSEIEEAALNDDTALAEIAACHQILTLVLGEPVRVPPTARQRMYRIVKGPESIPYRKPTAQSRVAGIAAPQASDEDENDDALLMGLTESRRLIPILGACGLLLLLVLVMLFALPSSQPAGREGYILIASSERPGGTDNGGKIMIPIEPKSKDTKKPTEDPTKKPTEDPRKKTEEPGKTKEPEKPPVLVEREIGPPPREVGKQPLVVERNKPNPERRDIGSNESKDFLVLTRRPGGDRWERVAVGKDIASADNVLALPGFQPKIRLKSGIELTLWGTLPEFVSVPILDLAESRIILHQPPEGLAADFTLESGRVFITRPGIKGMPAEPVKVRVRFKEEVWDLTLLDEQTEICVDLLGMYEEGVRFAPQGGGLPPRAEFYLGVLAGKAGVELDSRAYPLLEAPTKIDWDNVGDPERKGAGASVPAKVPERGLSWWSKEIPANTASKELQNAIAKLNKRLVDSDAALEVIIASMLKEETKSIAPKILAVHCQQALGEIEGLADSLGDSFFITRAVAVRATQHWTAQAPERDRQFYKMLMEKKGYTEPQARTLMQLLHLFSPEETQSADTFATLFDLLRHEKIAIRELAIWHLSQLDREGMRELMFVDVSAPDDVLKPIVERWKASWKRRWMMKK